MEDQRLRDNRGSPAAVEAVRQPRGAEGISAVGGPAAVNVVRKLCRKKESEKCSE